MLLQIDCGSCFASNRYVIRGHKIDNSGESGLEIVNFTDDSNLKEAGAKEKDILWKYNGEVVYSSEQLGELKKAVKTDMVPVILKHGDKLIALEIPSGQIGVYLLPAFKEHEIMKDAVVIEGIGKLGWGQNMDNNFFGCLAQIDAFKGEKLNYVDKETIYGVNKESIDDGWSLIAIDLIEVPEWGVITGYQNDGKELHCRTYFDQTEEYETARKIPWVVIRLKDKKPVDLLPFYSRYTNWKRRYYRSQRLYRDLDFRLAMQRITRLVNSTWARVLESVHEM